MLQKINRMICFIKYFGKNEISQQFNVRTGNLSQIEYKINFNFEQE